MTSILPDASIPNISVNTPTCEGEDLVFVSNTQGSLYEWISPLGDNDITLAIPGLTTTSGTTTIDPSHPAYLAGDWSVRVTDLNGCVQTSEVFFVQINPIPIAIASNDGPICEGEDFQLLGNTVAGATYEWFDADPANGGTLISTDQDVTVFNPPVGDTDYYLDYEKAPPGLECLSEKEFSSSKGGKGTQIQRVSHIFDQKEVQEELAFEPGCVGCEVLVASYKIKEKPNYFLVNKNQKAVPQELQFIPSIKKGSEIVEQVIHGKLALIEEGVLQHWINVYAPSDTYDDPWTVKSRDFILEMAKKYKQAKESGNEKRILAYQKEIQILAYKHLTVIQVPLRDSVRIPFDAINLSPESKREDLLLLVIDFR